MPKLDRSIYKRGREQVYVKHYLLEKYLSSWGYIIGGSEWDSLVFVDGFAGPWGSEHEGFADASLNYCGGNPLMAKHDTQRAAHEFLLQHLLSGEPFTLADFIAVTGWDKPGTYRTYLQKQYRGLIENVEGGPFKITNTGHYRVTESFRKLVEWPKFRQHVTQVRPEGTSYSQPTLSEVLIYDFLMPLTHETSLRLKLDALFFKDTLLAKLRTIEPVTLGTHFVRGSGESDDNYFGHVLKFIEDHFLGYSISHVDGRFRSLGILDYDEVAAVSRRGGRYLIDETTAITRFIFPYDSDKELGTVRFLFQELFVRSMIELVEGEDQIWMLENGPERRVHVWRAHEDDEVDEGEE